MTTASAHTDLSDSHAFEIPTFWCINRLPKFSNGDQIVFTHKKIEYSGTFALRGDSTVIVRACIVQPRFGGENYIGETPNAQQVFGSPNPTVATPIDESTWIRISDRSFIVDPIPLPSGQKGTEVHYIHRLSHNLSIQRPSVGPQSIVWNYPIFFCLFSDLYRDHAHIVLKKFSIYTSGLFDLISDTM